MTERYELSKERIEEIVTEAEGLGIYGPFFVSVSKYVKGLLSIYEDIKVNGPIGNKSLEELRERNDFLYGEIYSENYKTSYLNPDYAYETLGEAGVLLSAVYAEVFGMIPYVFECDIEELVIRMELFLEVYGNVLLLEGESIKAEELREILYYYVFDYTEDESVKRINKQLTIDNAYANKIIENYDLSDVRTLFAFGEYVGKSEEETFLAMASLDEKDIEIMSRTYTEGFKKGFVVSKKDLSKKKTVNLRYRLGFERVAKDAIKQFRQMGLESVIYRAGYDIFSRTGIFKPGYYGGLANPQFDEDHKEDMSLVLNGQLVTRRIEGIKAAYEELKKEAEEWAGPACMEIFGEDSFVPSECAHAARYGTKKQELITDYRRKSSEITNEYIKREERSFTIIAWPVPAIGNYEEILKEIITVNTLPVDTYQNIQQTLIDTLDKSDYIHVVGCNGNKTDLKVKLADLKDPLKETKYENCLADVNIPLGEVFTSPVLKGTEGVLHVKEVFLNDLKFKNIELEIKDGKISAYTCTNYEDEKKNKEFIDENLLFYHPTLPMGEAAIGTNTYAYALAKKYDIFNKLPILIAEKMGPHFAFGDTCYSNEESVKVYNPDGKEMIAKENGEAYTYCHTDVTIPYDELGLLEAVDYNGIAVKLIENGRFVLEGCEELNIPLEGI
ncbi:Thermophilic metalloprotease (M29) [Lachnospiraceae bacterium G41]|nr:Thermophilic metalloprotease (M29) [Lachnospiraceae bacterium G41]